MKEAPDTSVFTKKVAAYYDSKREDFNYLLAQDGLVHHHNGICSPDTIFPEDIPEDELLRIIHSQENALTDFAMGFLSINSSMVGLDAGSGRGASSFMFSRRFGCSVIGINISPYQTKFATEKAQGLKINDRVQFIRGEMTNTPFAEDTFDFVWACESTEHVPKLEKIFGEFERITKLHAQLLIVAWCASSNHPDTPAITAKLNEAYVCSIHTKDEYLKSATTAGWQLTTSDDLTAQTVPYWELRSKSANKPGTESFMYRGFRTRALEYHLMKFEKAKK